ncbi:hypothetical protein LCGC14_2533960 [marine sediment metagenome]|uniref:Uncharacterized protein n=1 Tax=marine sediment metagenome TaxID=412755 RepID=A0A0F9DKS7_9ZZZZ
MKNNIKEDKKLVSGYYEWDQANLDIGPVFSVFGFNDVEGLRIRLGGRTYFGQNDPWRLEGFGAYGFKDDKFKFGLSGKWLLDNKVFGKILIASRDKDILSGQIEIKYKEFKVKNAG